MRVYLSGPVTGQEDTADLRFTAGVLVAALAATKACHKSFREVEVINPYIVNKRLSTFCNELSHEEYMVVSIAMLSLCDTILMMRGWEKSEGCQRELAYAEKLGYTVLYQDDLDD